MEGIFTISLDFELHWGVFDKRNRQEREACYRNTLKLIPRMLQLFAEHEVHVTWATVGSMFAQDQRQWEQLKPAIEPAYTTERYSAYRWACSTCASTTIPLGAFCPERNAVYSSISRTGTRYPYVQPLLLPGATE